MSRNPRREEISREEAREIFQISHFTRLARTHVFSTAGDALFALGLAQTVFFDVDLDEARWRVALTLVLTVAPFAVVALVIGPILDRLSGGRRWMIAITCLGRAGLAFALVQHLGDLLLYPLAFAMLVLGKAYQVSKSAIVPTTVRNDAELVEANSKLSLLSGLSVVVAVLPGLAFLKLGGSDWVLGLSGLIFLVGVVLSIQLPSTAVAVEPADETERAELRSVGILLAGSAMGLLRGVVGFLSFLLAFDYKSDAAWTLGALVASAQVGFLVGASIAPRLRKLVEEEYILIGVLLTVVVASVGAAFTGGLGVAAVMSFVVGAGASAGKQAFDAIVQSDAPDANRGRSFARFETRFQLMWVAGALLPVVATIPARLGFVVVASAAGFAAASYWVGMRTASGRASELVRRSRRRERDDAAAVVARDLGFERGMAAEGTPIDQTGSAAARAARRRRKARAEQAAPEPDDTEGPNLDWNPDY